MYLEETRAALFQDGCLNSLGGRSENGAIAVAVFEAGHRDD